jgi:hypothetical protein
MQGGKHARREARKEGSTQGRNRKVDARKKRSADDEVRQVGEWRAAGRVPQAREQRTRMRCASADARACLWCASARAAAG